MDDGSRDGSPEILDALAAADPRIRVIRQPRNMGKGARDPHRHRAHARRHRPDPGRRSRVRPGRLSGARSRRSSRARPTRCSDRASPSASQRQDPALLARRRQPLPDVADQHPQRHQPDGHGDLLQGRPGRRPEADAAQQRSLRHRAGADDASWRSGTSGSTKCRSAITVARSPRARRSAGRTPCRRSGRS